LGCDCRTTSDEQPSIPETEKQATDARETGFEARLDQAKRLVQSARFADARSALRDIIEQAPGAFFETEARYMLAVTHRYLKEHDKALAALDDLIGRRPEYGRAHQERGHTLLALNRPDEAALAFAKAVEQNPGLIASWKALANLQARRGENRQAEFARMQFEYLEALPPELRGVIDLLHEDRLLKAEQLCRHFLSENKHHIEAMRLLAEIGMRLCVYDDAEFLLESCVELAPENLRARGDYVKILNRKGKFARALEQADILQAAQHDNPAWELAKASALAGLGRLEQAIDLYQNSLGRTTNKAGVNVMLGHAQKAVGNLEAAIAAYRAACEEKSDYGDAWWSLANTKTYHFGDDELDRIQRYEAATGVTEDDRVHLNFAAGKALEDRGEFEQSFDHYARGNTLKMTRAGYDPDNTARLVDEQINHCTAELFTKRGALGCDAPDPIFIVGLPRAGSTLLEQILASHSQVNGTMELHEILGLAQRLGGRSASNESAYPGILWELDDDYFERFGEKFIEDTRAYRGSAPLFIDKMPNNFMHIGLIRLILPNAKVIDARRHPMACCFSGFKQLFGEGQDFTYGLEEIGRYYADYVRLMDHWEETIPGFVLRVMHEDVVDDLETEVRRMLDFCGLPFEQACLEFHRTERSIKTPSSEQVRQPIYRTGLDYWRSYEQWLGPLKEALGEDVRQRFAIN
jgi:predicted Zn-dependent protease